MHVMQHTDLTSMNRLASQVADEARIPNRGGNPDVRHRRVARIGRRDLQDGCFGVAPVLPDGHGRHELRLPHAAADGPDGVRAELLRSRPLPAGPHFRHSGQTEEQCGHGDDDDRLGGIAETQGIVLTLPHSDSDGEFASTIPS